MSGASRPSSITRERDASVRRRDTTISTGPASASVSVPPLYRHPRIASSSSSFFAPGSARSSPSSSSEPRRQRQREKRPSHLARARRRETARGGGDGAKSGRRRARAATRRACPRVEVSAVATRRGRFFTRASAPRKITLEKSARAVSPSRLVLSPSLSRRRVRRLSPLSTRSRLRARSPPAQNTSPFLVAMTRCVSLPVNFSCTNVDSAICESYPPRNIVYSINRSSGAVAALTRRKLNRME